MCILVISKKSDGRKLLTNQSEIEGCLYLTLIHIKGIIGIQIERHQQMCLVRKTIACGTGLALNDNITILNTCCNESF